MGIMNALYIRVSDPTRQDYRNQLPSLRKWALEQFKPYEEFIDEGSGLNIEDLPELNRLKEKVESGIIERIGCWEISRLGRNTLQVLKFIDQCDKKGVKVYSISQGIDTSTITGKMMVTFMSSFAQMENETKVERQMAGISRCRAENNGVCSWGGSKKGWGRLTNPSTVNTICDLYKQGKTIKEIALSFRCVRDCIYDALKLGSTPLRPRGKGKALQGASEAPQGAILVV
jgi:DNA invertase Pin-like site-specific DNA recombinase